MTVLGRVDELHFVRDALTAGPARIIAIDGPRGVGKTTLASEMTAYFRDRSAFFDKAPITIFGHGKAADILADELYRALTEEARRSQRPASFPALITAALEQNQMRGLVFVDNLEDDAMRSPLIQQIMSSWLDADTQMVLMVTARNWNGPPEWSVNPKLSILHLNGLKETSAILQMLGTALLYRFSETDLLRAATSLQNVPQNLLYLRWANPTSLEDFLEAFKHGEDDASIQALRNVLSPITASELFVALGLLRIIEYTQGMLNEFWRKLSSNSPPPAELWDKLIDNQLLLRVPGTTIHYRVHPNVHLDLLRLSEERGHAWRRLVHECALDTFNEFLAMDRDDLLACAELVHHALVLEQGKTALHAIFGSSGIDRWRKLGLSVRIEQALAETRNGIEAFPQMWAPTDAALVYLASGEVASDLGRPKTCLDYLSHAARAIEGREDAGELRAVRRSVWIQMAISHANLGSTAECIDYYGRAIRDDPQVEDPRTALCMGYLGYEYCDLLDFKHAMDWSAIALASCSRQRDAAIFAKNLVNRALVLFYQQQRDEARAHLESALELVGEPGSPASDVREHGRVMLNLGMVYLSQRDVSLATVEQRLSEAVQLTRKAGDARREATAKGLLGIVYAFNDDFGQGMRSVNEALTLHRELGDLRNMTLETMNLLAIRALRNSRPDLLSSHLLLEHSDALLSRETFQHYRTSLEASWRLVDGTPLRERYIQFWEHCVLGNAFARAEPIESN